jgi:hypothetical protein
VFGNRLGRSRRRVIEDGQRRGGPWMREARAPRS